MWFISVSSQLKRWLTCICSPTCSQVLLLAVPARQGALASNVLCHSKTRKNKLTNQTRRLRINKEVFSRRQFCLTVEVEGVFGCFAFCVRRCGHGWKHVPRLHAGCDSELLPNRGSHRSRSETLHEDRPDSCSEGNVRPLVCVAAVTPGAFSGTQLNGSHHSITIYTSLKTWAKTRCINTKLAVHLNPDMIYCE